MTLTVIDPIFNPTAKLADRYISVKPGMDGWLAAGVLKILCQTGRTDSDFIQRHSVGFEEIEKLLQTISIEEIIEKTETSLEVIEYLADLYADGPPPLLWVLGCRDIKTGAGRYGGLTL